MDQYQAAVWESAISASYKDNESLKAELAEARKEIARLKKAAEERSERDHKLLLEMEKAGNVHYVRAWYDELFGSKVEIGGNPIWLGGWQETSGDDIGSTLALHLASLLQHAGDHIRRLQRDAQQDTCDLKAEVESLKEERASNRDEIARLKSELTRTTGRAYEASEEARWTKDALEAEERKTAWVEKECDRLASVVALIRRVRPLDHDLSGMSYREMRLLSDYEMFRNYSDEAPETLREGDAD